jgi:hypothetical protein
VTADRRTRFNQVASALVRRYSVKHNVNFDALHLELAEGIPMLKSEEFIDIHNRLAELAKYHDENVIEYDRLCALAIAKGQYIDDATMDELMQEAGDIVEHRHACDREDG